MRSPWSAEGGRAGGPIAGEGLTDGRIAGRRSADGRGVDGRVTGRGWWHAGRRCRGVAALVLLVVLAGVVPAMVGLLAPAAALGSADARAGRLAAPPRTAATSPTGYLWPVGSEAGRPPVRRAFDPPAKPWLTGHRGVDLAAPAGAPVRAAGPGQVVFAGMVAGRPVVSVQHASGLRTTYEPVQPVVAAGDEVAAGDRIGTLAAEGSHCRQACLHWGARTSKRHYIDPLLLVAGEVQVRLYPLPP